MKFAEESRLSPSPALSRIVRIYHSLSPPSSFSPLPPPSSPSLSPPPLAVFLLNYRTYLAKLPSAFQFALRVPSIIEFSARFFAFCAHENKVIPRVRDNIPFRLKRSKSTWLSPGTREIYRRLRLTRENDSRVSIGIGAKRDFFCPLAISRTENAVEIIFRSRFSSPSVWWVCLVLKKRRFVL